jgi:hypothetical protein
MSADKDEAESLDFLLRRRRGRIVMMRRERQVTTIEAIGGTFRNEFSAQAKYVPKDVVVHRGECWVCMSGTSGHAPPGPEWSTLAHAAEPQLPADEAAKLLAEVIQRELRT